MLKNSNHKKKFEWERERGRERERERERDGEGESTGIRKIHIALVNGADQGLQRKMVLVVGVYCLEKKQ